MAEEKKPSPPKQQSSLSILFQGLSRNLIIRGLLEIVVGLLLVFMAQTMITTLTIVIGAFLIGDGLLMLISFLRDKKKSQWTLINALALMVFGAMAIFLPKFADKLWCIVLGLWLITSSVNEFLGGGWRRPWSLISCLLSVVVGVCFIVLPFYTLELLTKISGWVMIVSGILVLSAGIDLRAASKKV